MIDIRQTTQYAKYLSKIGWEVERIAEINYFIKKVPLIGSVLKVQRPEKLDLNKVRNLAKKYRAFQIIVEPKNVVNVQRLMAKGFKLSKSPYLPTKTLQLDLTLSINRLISSMKKDARQALRKLQNSNFKCQSEKDLAIFRNAWKKAVGFKRYIPPLSHLIALKESFKNDCAFLIHFDDSNHGSEIAAGAIFLMGDKIAYYWQAFTGKEGRKRQDQYKIVWEGIKWAKSRGAKVFDFEGIYDERFPNKSWEGFTHFKKSFGGYEVIYPGAFVKNSLLPILG